MPQREVGLPLRIIGVGILFNHWTPLYEDRASQKSSHRFFRMFDLESPFPFAFLGKVFCFHPSSALIRVTSTCPCPESLKGIVINISEGFLTYRMSMKVGPTSDYGV